MNGQNVNESIGGQTDGCLDGWIDGWAIEYEIVDAWVDNRWINKQTNDGCMDGWLHGSQWFDGDGHHKDHAVIMVLIMNERMAVFNK